MKTEKLPKKWYIKGSEEFADWIKDYEKENDVFINIIGKYDQYYFPHNFPLDWVVDADEPEYRKEITFTEFKQHVLKEETMTQLPENYVVKTTNAEQVNICGTYMNILDKIYPKDYDFSDWEYCIKDKNRYEGWDIVNKIPERYKHLPIFTFEEWYELIKQTKPQEETMKLPTKNFGIKVTNENAFEIVQWFKGKKYNTKNYEGNSSNDYIYWTKGDKNIDCTSSVASDIKIYTLEEIKQIENQTKNNMETKELLGYKLINPGYQEVVAKLAAIHSWSGSSKTIEEINRVISTNSLCRKHLEEAGVLDIWFEKVYEEDEFKIGDWVTVTKIDGGGWLNDTQERTFQLLKLPTLYSGGTYWGVKKGGLHATFRKATEEEIEKATTRIITLYSSNKGIFQIKVSKGKAIYEKEGTVLPKEWIEKIINSYSAQFFAKPYEIKVTGVTVGCMENTKLEDWKKVLEAINETTEVNFSLGELSAY